MPEISVIMATYNNEKYITEAIESILKQTFELPHAGYDQKQPGDILYFHGNQTLCGGFDYSPGHHFRQVSKTYLENYMDTPHCGSDDLSGSWHCVKSDSLYRARRLGWIPALVAPEKKA